MNPIAILQLLLGLGATGIEQQQSDELIKRDEARFAEGTDLQRSQLTRLVAQSKGLTNQVAGGFGDLRTRTLADLAKVGGQERIDINRRFGAAQTRSTQDLTARGLGSSTILSSVGSGIERGRSDALGGLAERLRLARANADERITGNQLAARGGLGSQAIGLEANLGTNLSNTILNRSDMQPANPLASLFQLMQFMKPPPKVEQPKDTSILTSLIGGGSQVGAAALAGGAGGAAGSLASLAPFFALPSDRNIKKNLEFVDHMETLKKVEELIVSQWEYDPAKTGTLIDGNGGRHIGPMAQDFRELFGLGDTDTMINLVDAFGVALSAIKALSAKVHVLEERVRGNA